MEKKIEHEAVKIEEGTISLKKRPNRFGIEKNATTAASITIPEPDLIDNDSEILTQDVDYNISSRIERTYCSHV